MDRLPADLSSLDRYPSVNDMFDVLDSLNSSDDGSADPDRVAAEVREHRRFLQVLVAMAKGSWRRLEKKPVETPHPDPPFE